LVNFAAESLFVFARPVGLRGQEEANATMARSSEAQELDRLVTQNLSAALQFATRLTGTLDAAEDVLQEALVRVARSWKTFRKEAEFRTWLFRIVINVFRDRLARAKPTEPSPLDDLADHRSRDPANEAQTTELGELIAARISALPARQREVMVLTAFEGFSPRRTATLLSITEANVHSTLAVAREKLRKELASYLIER
jgi:RNA polymerase sigma-70 factor (ECF subfamily)